MLTGRISVLKLACLFALLVPACDPEGQAGAPTFLRLAMTTLCARSPLLLEELQFAKTEWEILLQREVGKALEEQMPSPQGWSLRFPDGGSGAEAFRIAGPGSDYTAIAYKNGTYEVALVAPGTQRPGGPPVAKGRWAGEELVRAVYGNWESTGQKAEAIK